jgi:predicted DNA-binding transcriptional regulator AlpA
MTTSSKTQQDTLLRVPDITQRLGGVSRSYWWAGVKDGKFPAGIKLSPRVTVWRASDIDALIATIGK